MDLFWSAFSCIQTEYGEVNPISPYLVQMRENVEKRGEKCWKMPGNIFYAVKLVHIRYKELYITVKQLFPWNYSSLFFSFSFTFFFNALNAALWSMSTKNSLINLRSRYAYFFFRHAKMIILSIDKMFSSVINNL